MILKLRALRSLTFIFFISLAAFIGPVEAARGGDAARGKQKAQMCVNCHGLNGISQLPHAPHLAGQVEMYFIGQMKDFRSGKRFSENMNVVAKGLSDGDIEDLAAWYGSIGIEVKMPE